MLFRKTKETLDFRLEVSLWGLMLKLIVSAIRDKRPLIKKETLSFEARGLSLGC